MGSAVKQYPPFEAAQLLDLNEAKRFLRGNPPIAVANRPLINVDADLSAYTQATPDALEFLGKQGYGLVYIGLVELDKTSARILAGWDAVLHFRKIRHLDAGTAAILSGGQKSLHFDQFGLGVISPELARELAKMRFSLALRIEHLSLEAARELAKHPDDLILTFDTLPDRQVLQALCFHVGWRLNLMWKRPSGDAPCERPSNNQNKRVFLLPHFSEWTECWLENLYIVDPDYYPDWLVDENSLVDEYGIITLL